MTTNVDLASHGASSARPAKHRRWVLAAGVAGVLIVLSVVAYLVRGSSGQSVDFTQRFDVPLESLDGQATTGDVRWSVVGGTFSSEGNGLLARPEDGITDAIATIALPAPPQSFSVVVRNPQALTGIVFRYENAFNYWSLHAAPFYANWVIYQRLGGVTRYVGSTQGLDLDVTGDAQTVTLRFVGNTVRFEMGGRVRQQLTVSEPAEAWGVGLVAGDPGSTRWEEVSVRTQ